MLQVGDAVPDFSLESDSAGTISSKKLRGQRYVIYFYPKDDTPGCTKEACSFRDNIPRFKDLGVPVFGASPDDAKAHGKFVTKYQLNFPLLIDPEKKLLEAFGVWVEKSMYGRTYFGVQRATFVIDAKGKVEHVWPKVKAEGHAAQVLEYLQGG
ncbi:MAG: thioredoxin-dependent thiol peroxidase [Xanthomonadales bacterium]|nr:thioredoxin-dependent thiol peroxidase [Xanthomonadales bacterium]